MSQAQEIKRQLLALQQRAAAEGRNGDDFDLAMIIGQLDTLGDEMRGLRQRVEVLMDQRDEVGREYDRLVEAVDELDDNHPIVDRMMHLVRDKEWKLMRKEGMLTPADMVEQFQALFGESISRDDAVMFTRWVTGLSDDIREDAKRLLAESIRQFLDGVE